jgi:Tol biopolymer transport system component
VLLSIEADQPFRGWPSHRSHRSHPLEREISSIKQLTFGGQNAEAYWNLDGTKITFQSRQPSYPDEQIYTMNADGSDKTLISTGLGRCTCSYFSPDGRYIYFSSGHHTQPGAQPHVDMSKGYVWMVNPHFELYRRDLQDGGLETVLSLPGYVAETTIAPSGQYMTFTANFEGDLDIYRCDMNGFNVKKLTDEYGYDGGPFVSWDGKLITYRRAPLEMSAKEKSDYAALLEQHLVRPGELEIWVMNADGSGKKQVTSLGGAAFAPFIHPNGKEIIFSSNHHDPRGREFDLFVINIDGTGLRQVTFTPDFDGFPMFSRDGKKLIWASNRHGAVARETNVFTADWKS